MHWGWFDTHKWDGNWLATEPIESYRPACGVRTADAPAVTTDMAKVTCKRCLAIDRRFTKMAEQETAS
jgi:hypothetical protein